MRYWPTPSLDGCDASLRSTLRLGLVGLSVFAGAFFWVLVSDSRASTISVSPPWLSTGPGNGVIHDHGLKITRNGGKTD